MENWKNLEFRGYNWVVSDMGNVKYLSGLKNRRQQKNSSGYKCFTKGNKMFLVHRMVALAFIDNPLNKKFVNHKDGDKNNNCVTNLEWVSKSENELHSVRVLGNKRNIDGFRKNWILNVHSIPVSLYLSDGTFIQSFKSMKGLSDYLGTSIALVSFRIKHRNGIYKNYLMKINNEA